MDKKTAHKLLDLVLSAKHNGVTIEFTSRCGKGPLCSIYIHEWEGNEIVSCRGYNLLNDAWRGNVGEKYTTEEIMEVLEGLQDAEH